MTYAAIKKLVYYSSKSYIHSKPYKGTWNEVIWMSSVTLLSCILIANSVTDISSTKTSSECTSTYSTLLATYAENKKNIVTIKTMTACKYTTKCLTTYVLKKCAWNKSSWLLPLHKNSNYIGYKCMIEI